MSRINADVIDVLENEKTRVEILSIGEEDAGDLIDSFKKKQNHIYRHQLRVEGADFNFYIEPIYSTYKNNIIGFQYIERLFNFTSPSLIPLCFSSLYASDNGDYVLTVTPTRNQGIVIRLYKYVNDSWSELILNLFTCSDYVTEV